MLIRGKFWSALIGFNIGVEIGQLSIAFLAYALFALWRSHTHINTPEKAFRTWIALPGSALIALTGLTWAIQRSGIL